MAASRKVFVLGLDGATWDVLGPLEAEGRLPVLSGLKKGGAWGALRSVFPPLSPVAWTTATTGKGPGKHGVFEFLESGHDPTRSRVNTSRAIRGEQVWETAGRRGARSIVAGVPMSYPPRGGVDKGFRLIGDFLSPANAADFTNDPELLAELEAALGERYRPWSTAIHDGGRESEAIGELTGFLDHHLRAAEFLVGARDWDLFMYNLMASDRIQHEAWHAWDRDHAEGRGRRGELEAARAGFVEFWERLDAGVGRLISKLPAGTAAILMSDHGFGPIEHYVNLNAWLLERGDVALKGGVVRAAEALVPPEGPDAGMVLQPDGAVRGGAAAGGSVPGKAEELDRPFGGIGVPFEAAHRLAADEGVRAGEFRTDFREFERSTTERLRGAGGLSGLRGRFEGSPGGAASSGNGRAAGGAGAGARGVVRGSDGVDGAGPDGDPGGLAVSDDRPARLHDASNDLEGLRADGRPSDGRDFRGLRVGFPQRGPHRGGAAGGRDADDPRAAGGADPGRRGRPRADGGAGAGGGGGNRPGRDGGRGRGAGGERRFGRRGGLERGRGRGRFGIGFGRGRGIGEAAVGRSRIFVTGSGVGSVSGGT